MEVDRLTQARMALSVDVNGVSMRPPSVPKSLARFVRPFVFYNDGQAHELSFAGSCLRVRMQMRNFVLCSRHQLLNARRSPQEITMVLGTDLKTVAISPDAVSQAILDPLADPAFADVADILIVEYAARSDTRDLSPYFLNLDLMTAPDLNSTPLESIDGMFALGFPQCDSEYHSTFDDDYRLVEVEIRSRLTELSYRVDDGTGQRLPGLVPLVPAEGGDPIPASLDGMSGAPVFFVHGIKQRNVELGFAGMIVRGGSAGRVHIVDAGAIRQAFRLVLNKA